MTRSNFLQFKKILTQRAKYLSVKIRIKKSQFRKQEAYGVSGYYSLETKTINLTLRGKVSYSQILATLAHEIRHAEHDKENLFIRSELLSLTELIQVVTDSENDCNNYAQVFMKSIGYELDSNKKSYEGFFIYPPSLILDAVRAWGHQINSFYTEKSA